MNNLTYIVYDNGGRTADRYTVIPLGAGWHPVQNRQGKWQYTALAMSEHPTNPTFGFSQMTECQRGPHLGKLIQFTSLAQELQDHIIYRFEKE